MRLKAAVEAGGSHVEAEGGDPEAKSFQFLHSVDVLSPYPRSCAETSRVAPNKIAIVHRLEPLKAVIGARKGANC